MHYLKCENCGHLNPLKTEYLSLCSKCGRKLPIHYGDWKKRNPEKGFEDFKALVAVSDAEVLSQSRQAKPKSKKLSYWIGFVALFAIFYAVGQLGGRQISQQVSAFFTSNKYHRELMAAASEINKSCPMMVDNVTRLDNTIVLSKNEFQYNYTILNVALEEIDLLDMQSALEPNIINHVKTSPDMKPWRNKGTTVKYYYKDKNGKYLFTVAVGPEQYGED